MRFNRFRVTLVGAACISMMLALAPGAAVAQGAGETELYVPRPNADAIEQVIELRSTGDHESAALIREMITTPQAVWFEGGTARSVRRDVRATMLRARSQGTVPVLVAYNLPYRDCAQYSAGGAIDTAHYMAWIDGFAAGIGHLPAIVILEPDGLGIIPFYNPFGDVDGSDALEWCQPTIVDETGATVPAPDADPASRFDALNHAVDRLGALANVSLYLDGTHSGWLGAGDSADRLLQAGVDRADGFFLNASNYQFSDRLEKYGTWTSKCIAQTQAFDWWEPYWCASQYFPATADDFSTWHLTDEWYEANVFETPTAHFVVDTSRNGQGPWIPPDDVPDGDPQDWCNPPDRGLGLRPTTDTGHGLIDAYVWIKIPGESDGECTRWGPGPEDPIREMIDPAAGEWFPEMALELVTFADPPLGG